MIEKFLNILKKSNKIVGFTGAGISTESGISDYRSKGGIWNRYQPIYFNDFVKSEEQRILYWKRKMELWPEIKNAVPNSGHSFFKKLYDMGKLSGLITQNIDGLHKKSGIPDSKIIRIHGTVLEILCLACGRITKSVEMTEEINLDKGSPKCKRCGGILKPNTISFGQNLKTDDLDKAEQLSANCDLMITMGSTLLVQPAAGFPVTAKNSGAYLAIITLSETPQDRIADFVFHEKIGDFVKKLGYL